MKNVLVLGGSGFVGAHVCEKLVREGWRVTVPTRRRSNASHLLPLPLVTVLELDVHDEVALARALSAHNAVVNLIAILHGSPAAFQKAHVTFAQKLARACAASGVTQLVHVSALGVDALRPESAPSNYLRSKGQGEAVLMQAAMGAGAGAASQGGFDLSILRPSVIFGADDQFINLFASLQKVLPVMPLAGAHARFQPVWVEVVAQAVVKRLKPIQIERPVAAPQVFELVGPDVYSLKELVQLSARLAGVRGGLGRPVVALPYWAGWLQALLMEMAPGLPLMSRDNLDSMKIDNIATGKLPGLVALGIQSAHLRPIAQDYLAQSQPGYGLPGIRRQFR